MSEVAIPIHGIRQDIRSQIAAASAKVAARREVVTLPHAQVQIQVRGLMLREREQAGDWTGYKKVATLLALACEDPQTGAQIWNSTDQAHHDEIAALYPPDADALLDAILRLSGAKGAEQGKDGTVVIGPSDIASPPVSVEPSQS